MQTCKFVLHVLFVFVLLLLLLFVVVVVVVKQEEIGMSPKKIVISQTEDLIFVAVDIFLNVIDASTVGISGDSDIPLLLSFTYFDHTHSIV